MNAIYCILIFTETLTEFHGNNCFLGNAAELLDGASILIHSVRFTRAANSISAHVEVKTQYDGDKYRLRDEDAIEAYIADLVEVMPIGGKLSVLVDSANTEFVEDFTDEENDERRAEAAEDARERQQDR